EISGSDGAAGGVTGGGVPKSLTEPSDRTNQPPWAPADKPKPTAGEPTVTARAGPEIEKVTIVPSGAASPSAPVTVAVTLAVSPGDREPLAAPSTTEADPADTGSTASPPASSAPLSAAKATNRNRRPKTATTALLEVLGAGRRKPGVGPPMMARAKGSATSGPAPPELANLSRARASNSPMVHGRP